MWRNKSSHGSSPSEPTHATATSVAGSSNHESDAPPNVAQSASPPVVITGRGKRLQYRNTEVCPWLEKGRCNMGDACNYAHSKAELKTKPDLACTKLCPQIEKGRLCKNGMCRFAHDFSQLRATNAFYKTKMCKFWAKGNCPSGNQCRHAHGNAELRKPLTERLDDSIVSRPTTAATTDATCTEDEKPNSRRTSTPYSVASDLSRASPPADVSVAPFDGAWQHEETAKPFLPRLLKGSSEDLPHNAYYSDSDGRMARLSRGAARPKGNLYFHPAVWPKQEALHNEKTYGLGLSEMNSDSAHEHAFGISMTEYQPNHTMGGRVRGQGEYRPLRWGSSNVTPERVGSVPDAFHHWRLKTGKVGNRRCLHNEDIYVAQSGHGIPGIQFDANTSFARNAHEYHPSNCRWGTNEGRFFDSYGMPGYGTSYNNGGLLYTPMSAPISPCFSPLTHTTMMPYPHSTWHRPAIPDAEVFEEMQDTPVWPCLPERHEDDNEWPAFDIQTPGEDGNHPIWSASPSSPMPSRWVSEGGGDAVEESAVLFCLRQLSAIILDKEKTTYSPHCQPQPTGNEVIKKQSSLCNSGSPWMLNSASQIPHDELSSSFFQDIQSSPDCNPNNECNIKPGCLAADFSESRLNPIAEQNNERFKEYIMEGRFSELTDTLPAMSSTSTSPSILSAMQQTGMSVAFSPPLAGSNDNSSDVSPSAADISFGCLFDLVKQSPRASKCPDLPSLGGIPLAYLGDLTGEVRNMACLAGPVPPIGNPFEPGKVLTTENPFSFPQLELDKATDMQQSPATENSHDGSPSADLDIVEDAIRIAEQLITGPGVEMQDPPMEIGFQPVCLDVDGQTNWA